MGGNLPPPSRYRYIPRVDVDNCHRSRLPAGIKRKGRAQCSRPGSVISARAPTSALPHVLPILAIEKRGGSPPFVGSNVPSTDSSRARLRKTRELTSSRILLSIPSPYAFATVPEGPASPLHLRLPPAGPMRREQAARGHLRRTRPHRRPAGQKEAALSALRDKAAGCLHGAERRGGDPTPKGGVKG